MRPKSLPLKIYIAASFKHLHGVRLLARELRNMGCEILDWTVKATPPAELTAAERRIWMDTDQNGGQVYEFCRNACISADLLIYLGASGQDAGVEIGLAAGAGIPILGIRGPLESPGLMLHGAITAWTEDIEHAIKIVETLAISIKREPECLPFTAGSPLHHLYEQVIKNLDRSPTKKDNPST